MTLDIRPVIDGLAFSATITIFFEAAFVKLSLLRNPRVIFCLLCQEQRSIGLLDSIEHRIAEKMSEK